MTLGIITVVGTESEPPPAPLPCPVIASRSRRRMRPTLRRRPMIRSTQRADAKVPSSRQRRSRPILDGPHAVALARSIEQAFGVGGGT